MNVISVILIFKTMISRHLFILQKTGKKTEAIEAVPAQYGYKPEHSLLREQVGAVFLAPNEPGTATYFS